MPLTAENILTTLPRVLADDDRMKALASGISEVLARRTEEISTVSIYPNIRALPEELLDILAYDYKVDWWDESLTLTEKRETLAQSWYVHKHMGTKAAVVTALSSIYPNTKIKEWYEYSGLPYHFKIIIPLDENTVDPIKHARVLSLVRFYKNLRSVLDTIEYQGATGTTTYYAMTKHFATEIRAIGAAITNE